MDKKAHVIWLTGISGAGKTTIAEQLCSIMAKKNIKHEHLDGDIIREFFDLDKPKTSVSSDTKSVAKPSLRKLDTKKDK